AVGGHSDPPAVAVPPDGARPRLPGAGSNQRAIVRQAGSDRVGRTRPQSLVGDVLRSRAGRLRRSPGHLVDRVGPFLAPLETPGGRIRLAGIDRMGPQPGLGRAVQALPKRSVGDPGGGALAPVSSQVPVPPGSFLRRAGWLRV